MKILITGWAGTGKSTIATALQAGNLPALDADAVTGLAAWRERTTLEFVEVDYSKPIDFAQLCWWWDPEVLKETLSHYDTVYFCGNAHNLPDFLPWFDRVFILQIDESTQRQRLITRTNNPYAKEPSVLAYTLQAQKDFEKQATALGAELVNAGRPVDEIVSEILARTNS